MSASATISGLRPAVFFDRDGVLNRDAGYVHRPEDFEWIEDAPEAIRWFMERGYLVFVVTNQSGVARGYYDENAVHALHRWMNAELAKRGAAIDAFYLCPHFPGGTVAAYAITCDCRKPQPGMIRQAMREWKVDAARSLLIGDRESDIAAAQAAGVAGFLYSGGSLLDLARSVTADPQGSHV